MNKAELAVVALAAVAVVAYARPAQAAFQPADEPTDAPEPSAIDSLLEWTTHTYQEIDNMIQAPTYDSQPNRSAFLSTIAACEGTDQAGGYACLFGSTAARPKTFPSFADHPRIRTYETTDGQFLKNGKIDYTTAAGRYQITETTWNGIARKLKLSDFGPASQDAAALELLRECGALTDIDAGRVLDAARKARRIWASLPGAGYGQGERTQSYVLARYVEAGGATA